VRGAPRAAGGAAGAGRDAAGSGSAAPRSAAPPSGPSGGDVAAEDTGTATTGWGRQSERATYDELIARAGAEIGGWRSVTINIPDVGAATVRIAVDQGNGGQPQRRHALVLDAATGSVQDRQPFSSQSTGQKARSWIRFLHTGEALGIAGQTIAGIVSLTSLVMVWTGLALAYRRLIVPLYARKS
jgi:uncharacterized iron-regulated membrane protein